MLPRVCAALWLALAANRPAFGQIYVSPFGSDANPGILAAPVATLGQAVALARRQRGMHPDADQRIVLRGGVYRLWTPLVLGIEDSPAPGHTLTFEAYPGERPVISGGEPITGWRKLDAAETPPGAPAAARGKLWVADLPDTPSGPWRFHALYDGFMALPRARSPQYLSRHPHEGLADRLRDRDLLEFPPGSVRDWPNLDDIEILARPNHDWLVNYLTLESVDLATGIARTTLPATYTLSGRFWVENVLEGLRRPGNWVLDTHERRLYLWPRGDAPGADIVAPRAENLVTVAGMEGCEPGGRRRGCGLPDRPAGGFRFVGLTFAHTDRDVWTPTDEGLQHDWDMWDKGDACLRFRVARDCEVRGCTFFAAGDDGIRADLYAQGIRIDGNSFHDLGGAGVLFCGYGPGTRDVNRGNEIVNNEFCRLGTLTWHSPAVFLWQSGHNLVAHNYIHDLPYNGIVLDGVRPRFFGVATPKVPNPEYPPDLRENLHTMRWREIGWPRTVDATLPFAHTRDNIVEDNEIADVMRVLGDGNAIYLSAAGKGNVVRRNVIYDLHGWAAIRTDDDQSYVTITQNVTVGGGIVVKDFNFTWNNLLFNAQLLIISNRPDSRVDHDVFVSQAARPKFYRCVTVDTYFGNAKGDTVLANFNPLSKPVVPPKSDFNLYFCPDRTAAEAFMNSMRKRFGGDEHSAYGNPLLRDPAHGDFRFAPGSPALRLGIASIDTTHVGLLGEPMVRRLAHTAGIDLSGGPGVSP